MVYKKYKLKLIKKNIYIYKQTIANQLNVYIIECLPYVIKKDGRYIFNQTLSYAGKGAAIKVISTVTSVFIDLRGYALNYTWNTPGVGIFIKSSKNVHVLNGSNNGLTAAVPGSCTAISITNTTGLILSRLNIERSIYGVYLNQTKTI